MQKALHPSAYYCSKKRIYSIAQGFDSKAYTFRQAVNALSILFDIISAFAYIITTGKS